MTHTHDRPLPITYRAELLKDLLPRLFVGECCSLLGVGGVGKSNLTQFMQRLDVQAAYGGNEHTWIVLIDAYRRLRGEHSVEYAIYEQMIHGVIMEAERRICSSELISWATDLHSRIIDQRSAHLAHRYLERICDRLCKQTGVQLIFVFDQFEDLWVSLEAGFFLSLRSLRDQYKYEVVYLVLTRAPLRRLRTDLSAVESFWELFSPHTYGLGMYSPRDAVDMLARLATRAQISLDDASQEQLLTLSGCHPALLRTLFWTFSSSPEQVWDVDQAASINTVAEECCKLWEDLSPDEQLAARALANKVSPESTSTALIDLRLKSLAVGAPIKLFSPVFAAYIQQIHSANAHGIVVDLPLRTVFMDGQPLPEKLARLEFKLIVYLARHTERVCSRDEILQELYKDKVLEANDQRLDTLLHRLRESLREDARRPRYLVIHRGLGVQLQHATLRE